VIAWRVEQVVQTAGIAPSADYNRVRKRLWKKSLTSPLRVVENREIVKPAVDSNSLHQRILQRIYRF
jgi:hypothetical protein